MSRSCEVLTFIDGVARGSFEEHDAADEADVAIVRRLLYASTGVAVVVVALVLRLLAELLLQLQPTNMDIYKYVIAAKIVTTQN